MRQGWCSRGASLPAEHSWLCPGVQQEIQVSMVPIWFIHLQPRHSFRKPSNILWLSCELREQGRTGGITPSPGPSSVPRSSSASWITHKCKKNLKTSSSSQVWGVAAPGPGLAVPKGMAAAGSGKRELEGLDAQYCCSFPSLRPHRVHPFPCPNSSSLYCEGQPFPFPWCGDSPGTFQPR